MFFVISSSLIYMFVIFISSHSVYNHHLWLRLCSPHPSALYQHGGSFLAILKASVIELIIYFRITLVRILNYYLILVAFLTVQNPHHYASLILEAFLPKLNSFP